MKYESSLDAIQDLGVTENTLTPDQNRMLDEEGYCLIELTPDTHKALGIDLELMRAVLDDFVAREGRFAGFEGKEEYAKPGKAFEQGVRRLANLVDKHAMFRRLITVPEVLAAAYQVIKGDMRVSSLNLRDPRKTDRQPLHIDWVPRMQETEPFGGVFVIFFVDESSGDNAPIRLVPRSHKKLGWVEDHVDDAYATHPDEIKLEVSEGWLAIMNTNIWHGGTENRTGRPRRALFLTYRRRDLPQLLNQKRYLRPETLNRLSEAESYLLSVRDVDPTQEEPSVGVGAFYRKEHGESRDRKHGRRGGA